MNLSGVPLGADSAGGVGMACEKASSGGDGVPEWGCGDGELEGCEGDLRCHS